MEKSGKTVYYLDPMQSFSAMEENIKMQISRPCETASYMKDGRTQQIFQMGGKSRKETKESF